MHLTKLEIARRQIDAAADIFLAEGDFLAVITLAGAAEEFLGCLIKRNGGKAAIDHLVDLDKRLSSGREWAVINSEVNGVKNALKHANRPEEDEIEIEPAHAGSMLSRAICNWAILKQEPTLAMARAYKRLRELNPER